MMKNIKRIIAANVHSPFKAEPFAKYAARRLGTDIPIETVETMEELEEAVKISDIILTATPSREALIRAGWVKPGTHFSCIGSDMEGKQELEIELTAGAKVFADDLNQVVAVGECEKAVKAGLLKPEDITEIGKVILGEAPGRTSEDEITVFDSTGIGLQDLMTASMVIDRAKEKGIGRMLKI